MPQALYRKYRPQTLQDIVGQEDLVTILTNAAIQGRFGHAYLFYGPRGTGKTSAARILAKLADCQLRRTDKAFAKKGTPCNDCDACRAIETGSSLDFVEIDAASNRGIDDIRELREHIKTLPSSYLYKVIIIDEVHMLTTQAFNALLKTLEEPPAHVIFILATTEYEKVPSTITSRTQKFHFKKLSLQDIIKKLEYIVKQEKIKASKESLELLAYLADGSVRDAESLLDQIASLKEGEVTVESIEKILGKVDFAKTIKMAELCIKKDLESALSFLYEIHQDGYNLFQFNKDLTEYLRRTLSLTLNPSLAELFEKEVAQAQLEKLQQHAQQADPDHLITLIKSLLSSYAQMKYNPFPIAPFEIAIITSLRKK